MANFASSVLANAQAVLTTKFNEAELRRKQRPVLEMAVKNSEICLPDYNVLRVSESRTVEVKYLKARAAGSGTAKAALHTGGKGDSASINLSWGTYVEKFYTSRKQAQNNVISFERMFQHEMDQAIQNLKDRAETAALAAMYAGRNQLASVETSGAGTWDGVTAKALTIASGDAAYHAQLSKQFMFGQNYRSELDCICDLILFGKYERVMNQGGGNSTNTAFQFAGLNCVPTVDTIASGNTAGQCLIMPKGSFGGLVWNDPENRKGKDEGDNNVGGLLTFADPYGSGITFDVSHYTVRRDESAAGGHAQDIVDEWEIALNIGWAIPPISTTNASPIFHIIQG